MHDENTYYETLSNKCKRHERFGIIGMIELSPTVFGFHTQTVDLGAVYVHIFYIACIIAICNVGANEFNVMQKRNENTHLRFRLQTVDRVVINFD